MVHKCQNKYERTWKEEGKAAFLRGQDVVTCPYDKYSEAYSRWVDGWLDESEKYDDSLND